MHRGTAPESAKRIAHAPITNANDIDRACDALRHTTSYITLLKKIVWCLLSLICVNEKENLRVNIY